VTPYRLVKRNGVSEEPVLASILWYGRSGFFWNLGWHLPDYRPSHPRRQ